MLILRLRRGDAVLLLLKERKHKAKVRLGTHLPRKVNVTKSSQIWWSGWIPRTILWGIGGPRHWKVGNSPSQCPRGYGHIIIVGEQGPYCKRWCSGCGSWTGLDGGRLWPSPNQSLGYHFFHARTGEPIGRNDGKDELGARSIQTIDNRY